MGCFEDEEYSKVSFQDKALAKGDYEYCIFRDCDFSGSDLSGVVFLETRFVDCDFSNAKFSDTAFRDVTFESCKMLGLHFDQCNAFAFSASFESCLLNHSSFYGMTISTLVFKGTQLEGVDFVDADLRKAVLSGCDLQNAVFDNTNLTKVDFRTCQGFSIDPERNQIKGAYFSQEGLIGLLDKYKVRVAR